jgi:DNA polymerase-3 subunit gamma/tau
MSYLVLARKWRPRNFADLVGQEHVAQTLRNAITQNRVAHAFLFTGARGVGKTTIARIMAKALNCLKADGVSTEPCLECSACTEIALGRDPDVAEIDGASNNSVEDVRRLQETLPYRPSRDRFKVVIIDEVHMLSVGAFNALLKTLEEPPPHVKFIFATTEVHKLPITILSRCQRYDFRLIPTRMIRERVAHILRQEGITFDDAAVALVAREAAGSMRDALSLLDQVIAGVQGELTGVAAARLLGVADHRVLYDLARMILDGDAPGALNVVALIAREGYDLPNVARALHGVIRDLVVARVVPEPGELLDVPDEERADLSAIAQRCDPADLERLYAAWAKVSDDVARSREARWTLEMAAVRLAHRPPLLGVDELLLRLRELEQRVSTGAPPPGGEGPRGGGGGGGGARPPAPAGSSGPARPPTPHAAPAAPAPAPAAPSGPPARFSAPVRRDDVPRAEVTPVRAQGNAAVASKEPAVERFRMRAPQPGAEPQSAPAAPLPVAVLEPTVDTQHSAEAMAPWTALVASMDGPLVPVLKGAVPLEVTATIIRLAVDQRDSFFRRKLATPESQSAVADGAERYFGARPTVELVQGVLPEAAPTIARAEESARLEARRVREEVARSNPWVGLVCEVLQGEVQRVRFDDDPT